MSRERNSGIVLGILAGAAIGSLLGVLFAPEKGVETRRKLRRKAEDLRDEALDHYEHLRDLKEGIYKKSPFSFQKRKEDDRLV